MRKKTLFLFSVFIIFIVVIFYIYPNRTKESEPSLRLKSLSDETVESLLITNFEENEYVSIGQALVFFNRLMNNNPSSFEEVKTFGYESNIYLPSDLVYNKSEWEELWRNIVSGKTVFEKINENTYSITLIQGYLKIYLNQQGYDLIKKGLIPPQLYLYSPFSDITDFESINLNKNANLGFLLELLMCYDCNNEIDRKQLLHDLVVNKVESLTDKKEDTWGATEIALYNYYSLGYYGEFIYFKEKGILDDIELQDLTSNVSIGGFLVLVNTVIEN